ncbi:hypothetical protein C8R48DRAFT_551623, partial [Suillus tomentosus]
IVYDFDMYTSLKIHTTETISSSQYIHYTFSALLQVCLICYLINKNWNFLKLHIDLHIFDNIKAKGATQNYNTKPNKKIHSSLKDSYLLYMNFHNITEQ